MFTRRWRWQKICVMYPLTCRHSVLYKHTHIHIGSIFSLGVHNIDCFGSPGSHCCCCCCCYWVYICPLKSDPSDPGGVINSFASFNKHNAMMDHSIGSAVVAACTKKLCVYKVRKKNIYINCV